MTEKELNMYGCSKDDLDDAIEHSAHPLMGGNYMLAMSILSDAQECIAIDRGDQARQFINRAKYVIRKGYKDAQND